MFTQMNSLRPSFLIIALSGQFAVTQLAAQDYDPLLQNHIWKNQLRVPSAQRKYFIRNFHSTRAAMEDNTWINAGPEGGTVWIIKTLETDPSIVFIGSIFGGLYKSMDGGKTWLLKGVDTIHLTGFAAHIADLVTFGNKVYVGGSTGLYVSQDLGENWEPLFQTISGLLIRIVIHPMNPGTIYVAYYYGPNGAPAHPGVLKLLNSGSNWVFVDQGLEPKSVIDLKMSADDPEVLYAATPKGVFMTKDGGASRWKNISGSLSGISVHSITVDESSDSVIYAGTARGIFKTTNLGNSWLDISGENFKNRFISPNSLAVRDSVIWAGTRDGLYKSSDGGMTWQEKISGVANTGIWSMELVNQNDMKLGTADGFYQSTDGGEFWQKHNQGLHALNNLTLAFDTRSTLSRVLVGTNSAGIYASDDAGEHWQEIEVGSAPFSVTAVAIHPDSQQIMFGGLIKNAGNGAIETGVYKSTNGGKVWSKAGLENNFINALAINPVSSQTLYAGTWDGLYKSSDGGVTWGRKSQGLEVEYVQCLAIDPQSPNVLYAGTATGLIDSKLGIYKSTNGGELWQYASDGMPSPTQRGRDIWEIGINPLNPQTIYTVLVFDGVYKTINGGRSWSKLHGLNDDFIRSITIDPLDTNRVYAAGIKIYKSDNAGQSWQEMMEGLPEYYGYINAIRVDPNDPRRIYAATYGYGVLKYFRTGTTGVDDPEPLPNTFALDQNYPNPFNPTTIIGYQIPQAGKVTIAVYNVQGQLVRTLINEHKNAGKFSTHWDGLDEAGNRVASGIYLYRMASGNFVDMKKMVLVQ